MRLDAKKSLLKELDEAVLKEVLQQAYGIGGRKIGLNEAGNKGTLRL
ncbi:hypothetical protein [Maribacter sp. 2307ULW6-5]